MQLILVECSLRWVAAAAAGGAAGTGPARVLPGTPPLGRAYTCRPVGLGLHRRGDSHQLGLEERQEDIMKFIKSKKGLTLLSALVVAVAASIGAYAFFTANGSGTGSATVGHATAITLDGTITGTLYPDGAAASVSIAVANPGSGSQNVGVVHLDSISTDAAHSTCDVSVTGVNPAFTMPDTAAVGVLTADDGAPGGTDEATATTTLQMNDTGVSQNSCFDAPLTLHLSSN